MLSSCCDLSFKTLLRLVKSLLTKCLCLSVYHNKPDLRAFFSKGNMTFLEEDSCVSVFLTCKGRGSRHRVCNHRPYSGVLLQVYQYLEVIYCSSKSCI